MTPSIQEQIKAAISAFASGLNYGVKTPYDGDADMPFVNDDLNTVYLIGLKAGRQAARQLDPQE